MRETLENADRMKAVGALLVGLEGGLATSRLSLAAEPAGSLWCGDLIGIELARAAGWRVGLIARRQTPEVAQLVAKVPGLELIANPAQAWDGWAEPAATAYLGADLPDLPLMGAAGLSLCPADAALVVRKRACLILESSGGRGAVREAVERLLSAQGRLPQVLCTWYEQDGIETETVWLAQLEAELSENHSKIGFR